MKDEKIIKRMPTKYEIEEYKNRKKKDIEIIGGICIIIIIAAASLLLIG